MNNEMPMYARLKDREVIPCEKTDKESWDIENRRVGSDYVGDVHVSTVFLPINHGFETPMWFESMIFGGPHDGYQNRYATYGEAEAGHKRIVDRLTAGQSPEAD